MLIINKNKECERHISVKIENFGQSAIVKSFTDVMSVEDVIDFLDQLNFDLRSNATITVFSDQKILILRS